jgi:fructose-specific phosphotransferase system IIC component
VIKRYGDAYRVGHSIAAFGRFIQALGVLAGVLAVAGGLVSDQGQAGVLGGILVGFIAGGLIYGVGTMVAAQGQILLALLDTAVNGSPFLDEGQKAEAMSL